jgi:hypothetical protein
MTIIIVKNEVGPGFAAADQTDPRLDNLFSILRTSDQGLEVCAAGVSPLRRFDHK